MSFSGNCSWGGQSDDIGEKPSYSNSVLPSDIWYQIWLYAHKYELITVKLKIYTKIYMNCLGMRIINALIFQIYSSILFNINKFRLFLDNKLW